MKVHICSFWSVTFEEIDSFSSSEKQIKARILQLKFFIFWNEYMYRWQNDLWLKQTIFKLF